MKGLLPIAWHQGAIAGASSLFRGKELAKATMKGMSNVCLLHVVTDTHMRVYTYI